MDVINCIRSTLTNRIYCGRFFNPSKGDGDHVLASRIFVRPYANDASSASLSTSVSFRDASGEQHHVEVFRNVGAA
jgi:hypothetical protein